MVDHARRPLPEGGEVGHQIGVVCLLLHEAIEEVEHHALARGRRAFGHAILIQIPHFQIPHFLPPSKQGNL